MGQFDISNTNASAMSFDNLSNANIVTQNLNFGQKGFSESAGFGFGDTLGQSANSAAFAAQGQTDFGSNGRADSAHLLSGSYGSGSNTSSHAFGQIEGDKRGTGSGVSASAGNGSSQVSGGSGSYNLDASGKNAVATTGAAAAGPTSSSSSSTGSVESMNAFAQLFGSDTANSDQAGGSNSALTSALAQLKII